MSDFGADASDFDSDFRAGLSDYASDFRDFPGDSDSDFNREVRHRGPRTDGMDGYEPAAAEAAPQQIESRRIVTMEAASWQRKSKATEQGTTPTPQGNKQGVQRTHSGGNIGTAPQIKTPYSGIKMANKAYSRKAP